MPTFHYEALNVQGQPVSGDVEADAVQGAVALLESRGFILQSIGLVPPPPMPEATEPKPTASVPAPKRFEANFLRTHVATVIDRAKSLIPALRALGREVGPGNRRNELNALIQILERGDPNEAERAFETLPEYWIPLLSAALSSDDPGRVLQQFIKESQRSDELQRQWKLTLAYPIFVLLLAGAVLTLLSIFVIPSFRAIFGGFNIQLPGITWASLAAASVISKTWPFVLVVCLVLLGALALSSNHWSARNFGLSRGALLIIGRSTSVARISQLMADLLEAGLSVPETLQLASQLASKKRLREALGALGNQLQQNGRMALHVKAPAKMAKVFHAMRAEMPAASRIHLLRQINQSYTEKAQLRLSWTRGIIEPLAILFIGSIVAIVVFSLFLPLIKLINSLAS
jgi:type IV pilus assembly protein PilC